MATSKKVDNLTTDPVDIETADESKDEVERPLSPVEQILRSMQSVVDGGSVVHARELVQRLCPNSRSDAFTFVQKMLRLRTVAEAVHQAAQEKLSGL